MNYAKHYIMKKLEKENNAYLFSNSLTASKFIMFSGKNLYNF